MTKVCHLTSAHPDDDIRIFKKECRSLAKAGYDVHLIAPGEGDTIVLDNVTIHHVKKNMRGRLSRMTVTVNEVYKLAKEVNADIYHFHDPELLRVGVKLKKSGKKVIYDVHEDLPRQILAKHYIQKNFKKLISNFAERIENFYTRRLDYIITSTPYIAARFLKNNLQCSAINNYPFKNELYKDIAWSQKENAVCYIGVISRNRGAIEIIKATGYLDQVKLYLAGSFAEPDLEQELKMLPEWNNVIYKGKVGRDGVKDILRRSKAGLVTLFPTPNHLMSHPIKLFEYMSAAIPFIASDFSYWKEILNDTKSGFFVNPDDPEIIAHQIKKLLDDDSLAEKMGKNGRKAVLEKYNWETEEAKLIRIYKELEDK